LKKVLIIYHSQSGNTAAMAKAISEGASAAGAKVVLKNAVDAKAEDILDCDIVAIGTPSYFGYMAGMVKDFFDRAWINIREKMVNKPYVTFGSKGGGGVQFLEGLERICDNMKMVKVFEALVSTRKPTEADLTGCRELGKKLAKLEKIEKSTKVEEPRL
jgi:flavorubredoxin